MEEQSLVVSDASSSSEEKFCSGEEQVASCAVYLSQELRQTGLPAVVERDTQRVRLPELLNAVHRLLQQHRSDQLALEELRTSLQRGRSDVTMQTEISERLKEELQAADKVLAGCQERERQLSLKVKSLSTKLRTEQDEVRRLKTSMQYKETQHSHEMRKREKEYSRLKLTLGQMVSDRNQQRKLGLTVLNALQRAGGKRRLWNTPGSSVEETYRAIVNSYEERQKAILVENGSLRESLSVMQTELVGLLNEQQRQQQQRKREKGLGETETETEEEEEEVKTLSTGHFQMPFDIVRDGIEKTFREHLQRLREQLQAVAAQPPAVSEKGGREAKEEREEGGGGDGVDVEALQSKLSDYREIIGRQEEMLEKVTTLTTQGEDRKCMSDSWVWREQERIDGDRTELDQQRCQLDRDRQLLIEAAKKLDRERQTFEDDKVAFLKEQFLDSSVFNNTTELDSFYGRLSSTPAAAATGSSGGSTHNSSKLDLRHDLSLCSDDGSPDVLNDTADHS